MLLAFWPANTNKTITIIAKPTAVVKIYIKLNNSDTLFTELTANCVYRNNDIWQAVTSLAEGEYLLKITATDKTDSIIGLNVIPPEEYDLTVLQRSLIDKVDSNNSWKVVG
jgi:hypothetical protein